MFKKNVLITGGRFFTALELARCFANTGHRVFVADSTSMHLCKLSKCVKKSFLIPSPRFEFKAFVNSLNKIIKEKQIDMIIPVFEESLYLAKAKPYLDSKCMIFSPSLSLLNKLHNKWYFHKLLEKLDISSLDTQIIYSKEKLNNLDIQMPFALKPSYSRGSFSLKKISSSSDCPKIQIDAKNPWIAQKWANGKHFCSYSICLNGKVQAHTVYPNKVRGDGGYCMSFEAIEHDKILKWVQNLAQKLNITGQLSFDFVEENENLFAIECNPRSTSGLHLLASNPKLATCFFKETKEHYKPMIGVKKKLGLGMLTYGWSQRDINQNLFSFIKKYFTFKDVVFCKKDLKPFLFQLFIYMNGCYQSLKYRLPIPVAFLHDLIWEEHAID